MIRYGFPGRRALGQPFDPIARMFCDDVACFRLAPPLRPFSPLFRGAIVAAAPLSLTEPPASHPAVFTAAVPPQVWLVGFAPDWSISHLSANCAELLGHAPADLIGRPAHGAIAAEALHEIRSRAQLLGPVGGVSDERLQGLALAADDKRVDASLRALSRGWLLVCEPAGPQRDHGGTVLRMAAGLRMAGSLAELCAAAARDVRALTGFERVHVLRLGARGMGSVIAESVSGGAAGTAPLMFGPMPDAALPAGAQPRMIADCDAAGVPILGTPGSLAPDLAACGLGVATPEEKEALAVFGARALVSLPLRRAGETWGAIACSHGEPRTVPFAARRALEVFAAMLGLLIDLADAPAADEAPATGDGKADGATLAGRVLVVEDNMLIAMEAEEIVQQLGAEACDVAGSVAAALRLLDAHAYDFALLDIELGHETSQAVAKSLVERGVRFIYASGYGGPEALGIGFPPAAVVTKPYGIDDLRATIRDAGQDGAFRAV